MPSTATIPRLASRLLLLPVILLALGTCGDDPAGTTEPAVAEIQLTAETVTLNAIGATQQLSATALDEDGDPISGVTFTWTSSDDAVASVDGTGLVEAQGEGTATITVEADGVTAMATVAVEVDVVEVDVMPADAVIEVGETVTLTATPRGPNGNELEADVAWSSSDGSVASVDGSGLVTGEAAGNATITAESEGVQATATVEVTPGIASVEISPAETELTAVGATAQLDVTVTDTEGGVVDDAVLDWSSSDEAVATVDGDGLVTALAGGSATITAAVGDVSGTAAVTVAPRVAAVIVTPDPAEVMVGSTTQLTARADDANGNEIADATFTWASDDDAVATVDATGLVSGVAAGTTTVTATADGVSGTSEVTVSAMAAPTLTSVSGDDQYGRTEQAFEAPLVVRVADADDNPVEGLEVGWQVTSGDGSLSEAATTTDAEGRASVTVSAGMATGDIRVEATAAGTEGGPISFTVHTTVMVVQIVDNAFVDLQGRTNEDFEVTIEVGDTIEFQYGQDGNVVHTATSTSVPEGGAGFDSGNMTPGTTFRFAPQVAGTWTFYCVVHPNTMLGATLVVTMPAGAEEERGSPGAAPARSGEPLRR